MKKLHQISTAVILMLSLSSCSVVGGIFKAGMGFGIFIVLAILVVVVWAIAKARKK